MKVFQYDFDVNVIFSSIDLKGKKGKKSFIHIPCPVILFCILISTKVRLYIFYLPLK